MREVKKTNGKGKRMGRGTETGKYNNDRIFFWGRWGEQGITWR